MSLPAYITAACVALGAVSIAVSARADTVCLQLASEVAEAVEMRQAGVDLDGIRAAFGEDSEAVALAWALPVEASPTMRRIAPVAIAADVYDLCVWGDQ